MTVPPLVASPEPGIDDLRNIDFVRMEGHFDLGNGAHSGVYLNAHQLMRQGARKWRYVRRLVDQIPPDIRRKIRWVTGPPTGGLVLGSYATDLLEEARSLNDPPIEFVALVRGREQFLLRPFYARIVSGQPGLFIDDVLNTGLTLANCLDLITGAGGSLVFASFVYDRLQQKQALHVPTAAVVRYDAPNYFPDECPLCAKGIPLDTF